MSDIDTEIKGSPGSIEGTASWLRDTLAPAVSTAADAITDARRLAGESWNTTAGDGFRSVAQRAIGATDDLESAVKTLADDLDDFASELRRCQNLMSDARQEARDGDLTVTDFVIVDPGPGLTNPSFPPPDATDTELDRYNEDVAAYEAQNEKIRVFNAAQYEADRVDRIYETACNSLDGNITPGTHASWILEIPDILGEGIIAADAANIAVERSNLLRRADDLFALGQSQLDDIAANSHWWNRRYRKFALLPGWLDQDRIRADRAAAQGRIDEANRLRAQAADIKPGRVARIFKAAGKILGPVGIGLGIYNDWQEGESVTQIAVSQGGGLLAGAAAGAGVGALVGSIVPGPGTAIGAVVGGIVGAGVSIFADGAIDSFFENGPDVGEAFENGVDALADTGEAIGDFVGGAAETVGGWFS